MQASCWAGGKSNSYFIDHDAKISREGNGKKIKIEEDIEIKKTPKGVLTLLNLCRVY